MVVREEKTMSDREDIAWEEQQKLRQKAHEFSNRLVAFEIASNNRDEKIEDLREDLDKAYDVIESMSSNIHIVDLKVDRLERTIHTYNKFMWGLTVTVLGALVTAFADGKLF